MSILFRQIERMKAAAQIAVAVVTNFRFIRIVRRSVVIRSIPKSGTNYLRLLISNYICNAAAFIKHDKYPYSFARISYDEMHNKIFPNVRAYVISGKQDYIFPEVTRAEIFASQYADFMYDHGCFLDCFRIFRPKKLILIYRNPFDFIVSRFYYNWKNRLGRQDDFSHPREVIDKVLPTFIALYKWMRDIYSRESKSQVALLSYEQLFLQPHSTFTSVLRFLNLPVYPELVHLSCRASSISQTRKEEEQRGAAIHAPPAGLIGSFARSGKVGQWMDFFTPEDFANIQGQLEANDIDYREFWLAAEQGSVPDCYPAALIKKSSSSQLGENNGSPSLLG